MPPIRAVEHFGGPMARLLLGALRSGVRSQPDAPHIVMYVTPWYRQAAGWFMVALGIALATRSGARVSFLINDMPYPAIHPHELDEIAAFDTFCREFEAIFPFYRLGAFAGKPELEREAVLNTVVEQALVFDVRHRTGIGTLDPRQAGSFARTARTPLSHLAAAYDRFLNDTTPDLVIGPGGVANGSFVAKGVTDLRGYRFASADSGFGALLIACHGVAAHAEENAETHAAISAMPAALLAQAQARGHTALARKMTTNATDATPPCDLLLPLGFDYDTAALGVGSLYATQDAWLRDTIDFVSRNLPNIRMIVRQHPHEAISPCAENLALIAELEKRAIPNLTIMRVEANIPVYGMLKNLKACIACQSTVVLEAQMLGIPAISARDKYFVTARVVDRPPTREAYYTWLREHLSGPQIVVSQAARDAAALMYFILEECTWERTRFTPHASDLWTWLHSDPLVDLKSPAMDDLVRACVADIPITTIKARRILGLPPLPDGVADPVVVP